MIGRVGIRAGAAGAARILREVFAGVEGGFAFRLWDGTEVRLGRTEPAFTVVVPASETFVGLIRDPTPLRFAEAFVESRIDIEGDLFAAMHVANQVEGLRRSPAARLRVLLRLWRGSP